MFLHHVDSRVCVRHLPAEHLAPGCTIERQAGRQCDALGSVLLRSLPCGCYFDTTTYLSYIADHEKTIMETLPDGRGALSVG